MVAMPMVSRCTRQVLILKHAKSFISNSSIHHFYSAHGMPCNGCYPLQASTNIRQLLHDMIWSHGMYTMLLCVIRYKILSTVAIIIARVCGSAYKAWHWCRNVPGHLQNASETSHGWLHWYPHTIANTLNFQYWHIHGMQSVLSCITQWNATLCIHAYHGPPASW